jgi:hypothetical protein
MTTLTRIPHWITAICLASFVFWSSSTNAYARQSDGSRGSRNVELVAHLPLGGMKAASGSATAGFDALGRSTGNLVLDQGANRPFVFVAKNGEEPGIVAVNIANESKPVVVGSWDSPSEIADLVHFKVGSKSFLAAFRPASGLSVLEVSDPDEGQFDVVAEVKVPEGLHHGFAYRHSDGRSYLFATGGKNVLVYDLERLVSAQNVELASIALPEEQPTVDYGFHSVSAQYEAVTETDRLYAAGAGGYYVFDVTDVRNPSVLAIVNSAAVQIGHGIAASPDGSHVVTSAGYRTAPMRIFDLRPVFEGTVPRIRTAAGAWTANWRNYAENFEMRWPFVFVAGMDDGLQVLNMLNPFEPFTVGYYFTWDGQAASLANRAANKTGAWDIDVRNEDGLIAVTDVNTGLWLFRMEGFESWDGRGWGFPNVSSVQDWENGPTRSTEW